MWQHRVELLGKTAYLGRLAQVLPGVELSARCVDSLRCYPESSFWGEWRARLGGGEDRADAPDADDPDNPDAAGPEGPSASRAAREAGSDKTSSALRT